jgi:hypothetical protein
METKAEFIEKKIEFLCLLAFHVIENGEDVGLKIQDCVDANNVLELEQFNEYLDAESFVINGIKYDMNDLVKKCNIFFLKKIHAG